MSMTMQKLISNKIIQCYYLFERVFRDEQPASAMFHIKTGKKIFPLQDSIQILNSSVS